MNLKVKLLLKSQKRINKFTSLSYYFIIISLLFISCDDSRSDEFEQISTDSPYDFHSIENHNGLIYASGGDVWNSCNIVSSNDGYNWISDSLTNKSVFDLYSDGQTLYGVGNDGYIFSGQPELQLSRTKYWGLLRAIAPSQDGFIAVGGKNFENGWVYNVSTELQIDTAHFIENELQDIICNESGNCIACGYGVILQSNDSGISWKRSTENGDFYNSIAINNEGTFFIVGYNGTIIRSHDNGVSWEKLKNGNSPLVDNKPFRKIKFYEDQGVIIGDNGLIWISQSKGKEWLDISIKTDLDLFDFIIHQSNLICVSEAGQIFKIPL